MTYRQMVCPECGSENVATTAETMWMVNSGDHYCQSVKAHDADAKALCLSCRWDGVRVNLIELRVGTDD